MQRILRFPCAVLLFASCLLLIQATRETTPGTIATVLQQAQPGDVVSLADGTYPAITVPAGVTVRATNPGKVTTPTLTMSSNSIAQGIIVKGGRPSLADGILMFAFVKNVLVEDCEIRESGTMGVCIRSSQNITIRRSKIIKNGTIGFAAGQASVRCANLRFEDCEIAENNPGIRDPYWKNNPGKVYTNDQGITFRLPGDEAGGGKITCTDGIQFIRCLFRDNVGPGCWTDVNNTAVYRESCEAKGNKNCVPNQPWEAPGFADELSKIAGTSSLMVNCYSHDNTGSDYALWEFPNVTIRDSIAGTKGIELRAIDTRESQGYIIRDVLIERVKFYGQARMSYWPNLTPAERQRRNIVEKDCIFGLTGQPQWTPGGSSPPPTTKPTESPDPSRLVGPGSTIVTSTSDVWVITSDLKLTLNGAVRQETSGVNEIAYKNKEFYQLGNGIWWKWRGGPAPWEQTTDPGAPAPPDPPPPTNEVDKLKQQLADTQAKYEQALTDLNAARSTIEELESQVATLQGKIARARQDLE